MQNPVSDLPVHIQMMKFATAKWVSKPLWAVVSLGIPDLLATGPKSTQELAQMTDSHEPSLYRVMRALASVGVFSEISDRKFDLTNFGSVLKSDHPHTIKSMVLLINHPTHDIAWNEILYTLKTGKPAFEKAFGVPIFEYFKKEQEFSNIFNAAMSEIAKNEVSVMASSYDFRGFESLMDVGGGHGVLLIEILSKHPGLRGIVFDLPHVVEGTRKNITARHLEGRCEAMGGDFFQSVPPTGAIIMSHIIHDWNDEKAGQILKNCNAALPRGGKLLVCDAVINPGNHPTPGKLLDLEMLLIAGGKERTEEEFSELFRQCGFRLNRVVPTKASICIMEGIKN